MTGDLFQGGLLEAPCTLSNQVFRGGHLVFQGGQAQWSNYSIIYEGAGKYGERASVEKFFEAPSRPPQKSHFWKQKACKATNE